MKHVVYIDDKKIKYRIGLKASIQNIVDAIKQFVIDTQMKYYRACNNRHDKTSDRLVKQKPKKISEPSVLLKGMVSGVKHARENYKLERKL